MTMWSYFDLRLDMFSHGCERRDQRHRTYLKMKKLSEILILEILFLYFAKSLWIERLILLRIRYKEECSMGI